MTSTRIPALVAHRGDAVRDPENTLPALRHAASAGACYVEFDVQLTADGVPVLLHDDNLQRMAGAKQCIHDLTLQQARNYNIGGSARLATLADAAELLGACPTLRAFVEIKRSSLRRFGVEQVFDAVLAQIDRVRAQCIVISFDEAVVRLARTRAKLPIGWVFEPWSDDALAIARALQPEYVFTDHEQIPPTVTRLPPAPWQWVLYEVADARTALDWAARGADLIETFAIGVLLQDPQLRTKSCPRAGAL